MRFIDTHTHFDIGVFDADREQQAALARDKGIEHVVLIGYMARYFTQMVACQQQMTQWLSVGKPSPKPHLAFGLHPFYITEQTPSDLQYLEQMLAQHASVAIGEIGLDTFSDEMKQPANYAKQQAYFAQQLQLATQYALPVVLHIRRAHGDTLKIIKGEKFKLGGIAHSFSGGIQEAKAFVQLGFKIGVTGQVTNPNAKKLRNTLIELVKAVGIDSLVIETDCPDFTPLCCHQTHGRRNVPANLPAVLQALAQLLQVDTQQLAETLWHNSVQVLRLS